MNQWNRKNSLWMLLYVILYVIASYIVCAIGAIHPVFFVCYQISAGILVSGVVIHIFAKIKAPGVAAILSLGVILTFVLRNDASIWHIAPLVVMAVLAETVRIATKYNWVGDVIGTVIMTFSSFGLYGQIWFNRAYTYECALEEMPAGYADTLMAVSPAWALPVVLICGIVLSIIMSNVTAKLFKLAKT